MKHPLRFSGRLIATVLFSTGMWFSALLVNLLTMRHAARRYRIRCRSMSFWGYGVARIWGMRIRTTGTRPDHPYIMVSNHVSYADIVLMCAICPSWFISKAEVASWPGIGGLTRCTNTLFINRELMRDIPRMNRLIAERVERGESVTFFPEGTTSDGTDILPLKPSLLQPAIEANVPVHLATLRYDTGPAGPPVSEAIAWYGDMEFAPHVKSLLQLPGFSVTVHFHEQPVSATNRKDLARELHQQLRKQLQQMDDSQVGKHPQ